MVLKGLSLDTRGTKVRYGKGAEFRHKVLKGLSLDTRS